MREGSGKKRSIDGCGTSGNAQGDKQTKMIGQGRAGSSVVR